jgi:hypothetical protein
MFSSPVFSTLFSARNLICMRFSSCIFPVIASLLVCYSALHSQGFSTTATKTPSITTSRTGWRILPAPNYAPETSFALTLGGVYFFAQPDGDSTSRLNQIFGGVQYTLRNQFVVSALPEMYFNHENIRR